MPLIRDLLFCPSLKVGKNKPPYAPSTREMGYYQGAGSCITGPSPSLLRSLGRPPLDSVQHSKEELEVQMQFNKQQGR